MFTEVAVETVDGVRIARDAGADRVELCADLAVDGLTPNPEFVAAALATLQGSATRAVALIRSRPGNFVYSAREQATMCEQVVAMVDAGVGGVVIGGLTASGTIDVGLVRDLASAARGVNDGVDVVVHRAFDAAADQLGCYDLLASLTGAHRIDRILTSGGAATAPTGTQVLTALVRRASAGGPDILAGGGIRPENVAGLIAVTGVTQVHFSGRVAGRTDRATVEATVAAANGRRR